ncbi:MAG: PEP-CTERM sorting domain-containing protein [Akkermansiaceae bacterium]
MQTHTNPFNWNLLVFACALVHAPLLHSATVIANSDTDVGTIPAGTPTIYLDGTDAHFEAPDGVVYDGTTNFSPSDWNSNLVLSGPNQDGEAMSSFHGNLTDPGDDTFTQPQILQITDIPVITRNDIQYFAFVMDSQETGGNGLPILTRSMTINIHSTSAYNDPTEVWSNPYAVQLNGDLPASEGGGAQNESVTPLGQGSDLYVLVPVSKFYGFSTDDYFEWIVIQEDSNNGNDEWALAPGTTFFESGITLSAESGPPEDPEAVPEPSSISLLGLALVSVLLRRRR